MGIIIHNDRGKIMDPLREPRLKFKEQKNVSLIVKFTYRITK